MSQHVTEFTFTVHTSIAEAFPLFGPEGERRWAGPDWDPQFFHPIPAKDVEGAVFRIRHRLGEAIWINAVFDATAGHAVYVYVIQGRMTTRIDVQLTPINTDATSVRVMYERTALDPSMNEKIGEMAKADSQMGPEWEKSIADYLQKR